jgi:AP-1 complex subunit gamma-1
MAAPAAKRRSKGKGRDVTVVTRIRPNPEKAAVTHALVAAALVKLVTRCPGEFDRIRKMLRRFECSLHVDLQQRSCEFLELLETEWDSSRAGILDRMPVSENDVSEGSREVGDEKISEVPPNAGGSRGGGGGAAAPAGGGDLLDLLLDDGPAASPAPRAAAAPAPAMGGGGGGGGDLLDLLDAGPAAPSMPAAPAPAAGGDLGLLDIFGGGGAAPAASPMMAMAQDFPPMVAFEKNGLKIVLNMRREAGGSVSLVCKFANSLDAPMTNFVFEAAVPKYIRLGIQPATGQVLPPRSDVVSQNMSVTNTSNGEKPLLMKLRIGYMFNGQSVQEMGQVNGFPQGF